MNCQFFKITSFPAGPINDGDSLRQFRVGLEQSLDEQAGESDVPSSRFQENGAFHKERPNNGGGTDSWQVSGTDVKGEGSAYRFGQLTLNVGSKVVEDLGIPEVGEQKALKWLWCPVARHSIDNGACHGRRYSGLGGKL
jgi:hypothetical protein